MRQFFALFIFLTMILAQSAPSFASSSDSFVLKAQNWLNSLTTLEAEFEQHNGDRTSSSGILYLDRPGKLRFQYNTPNESFMVADGIMIHFYDAEMDEASNAPIRQTPAYFLLSKHTDFSSPNAPLLVEKAEHTNAIFRLHLTQREDPFAGKILLDFTKVPFALTQWQIIDANGFVTLVKLKNPKRGHDLKNSLFVFKLPERSKYRGFNN